MALNHFASGLFACVLTTAVLVVLGASARVVSQARSKTMRSRLAVVLAVAVAVAAFAGVQSAGAVDVSSPPRVSIGGGSVVEGLMTRRYIRFTVTLSWPAPAPVTVTYATGDPSDTATPLSPADYKAKSGTLLFKTGQRNKLLGVLVWPDQLDEGDETFTVHLSNPSGASLGVGDAVGTIIDDEPYGGNRVSIGDGTTPEMCVGRNTPAAVVVTLAARPGEPETVQVATGPTDPVSAVAGVDYVALTKTVTFSADQVLKEIRIPIRADLEVEGSEQFKVTLAVVSGPAPVKRSEATVTILDCVPT